MSNERKGDAIRYNVNKIRFDLIHPLAEKDLAKVLTLGAEKYFDRNWERGFAWTGVLASLRRHIDAFERGEDYDPETKELHIAHAACNVHFLNAFYYIFPQGDDRVKSNFKLPKIGLDIDEVLANFVGAWADKYGTTRTPNSWFYDRKMKERFQELREKNELDDFYMNIKPLILPMEIPFEPHCYITSRPVSKEVTEAWLDKYEFPAKPVYALGVGQTKSDAAKEAGIEIFIDDSYENFVELNNAGIFTYLFTQSHNKRFDVGHMRLNSLKELPLLK